MDLSELSFSWLPPQPKFHRRPPRESCHLAESPNMVVKFRDVFPTKIFPSIKIGAWCGIMIPIFSPTNHGSVENWCISKISFHFLIRENGSTEP